MSEWVIYEQPCNELVRVLLRLEYLFAEVKSNQACNNASECQLCLHALSDCISVLDRADLKGKWIKALHSHLDRLKPYQQAKQVDQSKLQNLLSQIDTLITELDQHSGKLGEEVRSNEFLHTARNYLFEPAGLAAFNFPSYHCWLQQPTNKRQQLITGWLKSLTLEQEAVTLLLSLIRSQAASQQITAETGYYEVNNDGNEPYQLIQVSVAPHALFYPVISAGKQRVCIRFYDGESSPAQKTSQNVNCKLLLCQ